VCSATGSATPRALALVSGSQPGSFGIIGNVKQPEAEHERLTALGGLAALSLDALSSVAYGAYAVSKRHLGTVPW
jgi:hypothetical protein